MSALQMYQRATRGPIDGEAVVRFLLFDASFPRSVQSCLDEARSVLMSLPMPHDVLTVDEVLIALRKTSALRYDEAVPGFHCYGADLCFQAHERGLRVVAIDAPLVHLSTGKIDVNYERASEWLLARWGERHAHLLPMPAATLKDPGRASWLRRVLCWWRQRRDRLARNENDCGDPRCAVRQLGESVGLLRTRSAGKS